MTNARSAAVRYAAAGIPVFPLHTPTVQGCSCWRPRCDRPGKHPRWHHELLPAGLHSATTEVGVIERWWSRWPDANIGLRTGILFDVCDIDGANGLSAVRDLLAHPAAAPPTVRTGSGGWHLYFAATGHGNRVRLLPDTDWRGTGGYVVAPPSRHASGWLYRWSRPWVDPLPQCPPELLALLSPPTPASPTPVAGAIHRPDRYAAAALRSEATRVAGAAVGQRNHTLFRAAASIGELVAAGSLSAAEAERSLTLAAATAGLPAAEIARTIQSGLRAGSQRPRIQRTG